VFNRLLLTFALLGVGFIAINILPNSLPVQSYLATAQSQSFTISGRVTDGPTNTGNGISGVSILLVLNTNTQMTAQTGADGTFSFTGLPGGGTWEVTPSKPNYQFQPTSRGGSNLGGNPAGETSNFFTGTLVTPTPTPTPAPTPATNPLENADFFVNQHYRDFLGRDADAGGLSYWSSQISGCGSDANCIRNRRIGVSAAFFVELEFQRTGSFVYRLYKGGLARRPTFQEFNTDRAQVVEGPNLEADKQALALAFVQRNEFLQKYAGQTTANAFVDALIASIQLASNVNLASQRTALVDKYNTGANINQSRAFALRDAIDSQAFVGGEYNAAFVSMQYFGYLRRDPDQGGYNFWLGIVNNPSVANYYSMVCAFLTSREYQQRFSSQVPRNDSECANIN